ncbi:MAG: MFS transporter, partial [Chloroflexi bacterium]|nr:MFS transporter [Chloroflexota bacterium]
MQPSQDQMGGTSVSVSDRRERVGWYFYDWANSAFPTTVVAVFLGPYLTTITKAAADADGFVHPLGIPVAAGSFFPFVVSTSVLLQVLFLPILGAIADYSRLKKQLLALFAYLGAFATMGMYFLQGKDYLLGGALFIFANVTFGASVVFYYAFLPEIASPDRRDAVSSTGWAIGYLGGGLLLAANLLLYSRASGFGLSQGDAVRISLASAGLWWALFTLIPLAALRNRQPARALPAGHNYLFAGFRQLRGTLGAARGYPQTLLFLAAYLAYNDGVQTVIALAAQFGQEALGLPISTLTSAILMVQFVAFFGALFFGFLAGIVGAKRSVGFSLV